ncbi:hypothetical protein QT235_07095 [Geobacillus stearothermophilus]|nr:hypothetical protein QT235_07095 [Geobacillus stearothermophilus]
MTTTFSAMVRHCFLLLNSYQPPLYIKTATHETISFLRFRHLSAVLYITARKIAVLSVAAPNAKKVNAAKGFHRPLGLFCFSALFLGADSFNVSFIPHK